MKSFLGILFAAWLMSTGVLRSEDSALGKDMKQTAKDTGQLVKETKEEFLKRIEKVGADFDEKIGQLEMRAEGLDAKADASTKKKLHAMRLQRKALDKKLSQLRKSSGAKWDKLKEGVDQAVDDLKKAYEDLKASLN
jgi:hypothetical protein